MDYYDCGPTFEYQRPNIVSELERDRNFRGFFSLQIPPFPELHSVKILRVLTALLFLVLISPSKIFRRLTKSA